MRPPSSKERCPFHHAQKVAYERQRDRGRSADSVIISRSLTDPEQFAVLFRRYAPAIQRYVTRRIGPHAADDVVAETFLVAFRQRATFRTGTPDALPWLYGIATNVLRRHWRTEVQQLRLLARTGTDPVTAPFTDQVEASVSTNAALAARPGPAARPAAGRAAAGGLGRADL